MINKVYDILKPLEIPVLYVLRPDIENNRIGISYHFFNEGYNLFGDGKGKRMSGSLQVDIFSTIDYTGVVKRVKELLELNSFKLSDMRDSDDSFNNIQYYHKILIFNYVESEVLHGGASSN